MYTREESNGENIGADKRGRLIQQKACGCLCNTLCLTVNCLMLTELVSHCAWF